MTTAPARQLTIEEFFRDYSDREGERWELVAGVPVMAASESWTNRTAVMEIAYRLRDSLGTGYVCAPDYDAVLSPRAARGTVRVPDLIVRARAAGPPANHGDLTGIRLVVEVVSPGTVRTDRVAKRREYAAAGIPAYLVVDVRAVDSGGAATLTLYDRLVPGPPAPDGAPTTTYADPTGDGTSVSIRIDECEPVTITAAELRDAL